MKVLYASSEALPFVASGGLADVAGSLPQALRRRRVGCRVVLPLYGTIPQELRDTMQFITSITVPVAWRRQYCGIFEAKYKKYRGDFRITDLRVNRDPEQCSNSDIRKDASLFMALLTEEFGGDAKAFWKQALK